MSINTLLQRCEPIGVRQLHPWNEGRRKEIGECSLPARTPTHHLILYELVGYIRHLVHRIREPPAFRFPPRSREPVRDVSHCPRRVCGAREEEQGTGRSCLSITGKGRMRVRERGKYGKYPQGWASGVNVAYEEGPCLQGKLQAPCTQQTVLTRPRRRLGGGHRAP